MNASAKALKQASFRNPFDCSSLVVMMDLGRASKRNCMCVSANRQTLHLFIGPQLPANENTQTQTDDANFDSARNFAGDLQIRSELLLRLFAAKLLGCKQSFTSERGQDRHDQARGQLDFVTS